MIVWDEDYWWTYDSTSDYDVEYSTDYDDEE